ncbi:hypothetical protein [Ruminococcus sp.]|uniref:hypothetical protein n=1 Tax=Ruminococcus sp. TaxID=41978 RepID=UPI002600E171|nr:hypothetical protein [Ruminococcus sp.]
MKDILSNVWVKRAVSVFNLAYFAVIFLLTAATFLYDLEFAAGREKSFFTVYVILSVVFLGLMLFSRREIMTRIISIFMLPVVFCLILFNMGDWVLIVPPFVVAVIIFFAAGTGENVKVVMGTIYLLMYVLGIVAYFVLNILFGGTSTETVLNADLDTSTSVYALYRDNFKKLTEVTSDENTISPDGRYQIVLYDVKDSDKGAVKICVLPYNEDIELKFFTLKQKGIKKTISNKGIRGTVPDVGWVEEDGILKVQYRLSDADDLRSTSVTTMPDKQYLEFLGIE